MDPQLAAFINNCYLNAVQLGLSTLQPIEMEVGDGTNSDYVIVSAVEPVDRILRLNVYWLVSNESDDNYFKLLVRESKNVSAQYQHTWREVIDFAELSVVQVYDESDFYRRTDAIELELHKKDQAAHPGVLWERGGQTLSGPLFARPIPLGQQYSLSELIPRKLLVDMINIQSNGFFDILLGINERLFTAEEDIIDLKRRLTNVETGDGGDVGAGIEGGRFYVYIVKDPTNEIIIQHNFGSYNLITQVWQVDPNEGGDPEAEEGVSYVQIMPDSVVMADQNFLVITTATQITGRVIITAPPGVQAP